MCKNARLIGCKSIDIIKKGIIIGFYKYKTIKSLKDELISYNSECCSWFNKRKDINSIIVDSVGGNTFRAFNNKVGNRPSIIFRKWATESFGDFMSNISEIFTLIIDFKG